MRVIQRHRFPRRRTQTPERSGSEATDRTRSIAIGKMPFWPVAVCRFLELSAKKLPDALSGHRLQLGSPCIASTRQIFMTYRPSGGRKFVLAKRSRKLKTEELM